MNPAGAVFRSLGSRPPRAAPLENPWPVDILPEYFSDSVSGVQGDPTRETSVDIEQRLALAYSAHLIAVLARPATDAIAADFVRALAGKALVVACARVAGCLLVDALFVAGAVGTYLADTVATRATPIARISAVGASEWSAA